MSISIPLGNHICFIERELDLRENRLNIKNNNYFCTSRHYKKNNDNVPKVIFTVWHVPNCRVLRFENLFMIYL